MPQVSLNHVIVSAPVVQFFSPSSDVLHRCICAQKETSPSMVSSLASGVEYKSFIHGAFGKFLLPLRPKTQAQHLTCAW